MSLARCEVHDQMWDSDKLEHCPKCEDKINDLIEKRDQVDAFQQNAKDWCDENEFEFAYKTLGDTVKALDVEIEKMREAMFK